jgi:hypothetical protein
VPDLPAAAKSDKGDYFVGVPPACRHAMPAFAKLGRWALTDSTHVTLDDPSGTPLLRLEAQGEWFSGTACRQDLCSAADGT